MAAKLNRQISQFCFGVHSAGLPGIKAEGQSDTKKNKFNTFLPFDEHQCIKAVSATKMFASVTNRTIEFER